MKGISILIDVLGPVMRGPSSSHTAGAYHLGALARSLLGEEPARAEIAFDPGGSYGKVYREQGSDLAFAAGLLGWSITDDRFRKALDLAASQGLEIRFLLEILPGADHPNTVRIRLEGRSGRRLDLAGKSIGGGAVEIVRLGGWPVLLRGDAHEVLAEAEAGGTAGSEAARLLESDGRALGGSRRIDGEGRCLIQARRSAPLPPEIQARIEGLPGIRSTWRCAPLSFIKQGASTFQSAAEMISRAEKERLSLGETALRSEAKLLGLPEESILEEMARRLDVMVRAVRDGLQEEIPPLQLLHPTARKVFSAEAEGKLAAGGLHARAAARALAAMHINGSMGVVCAAPTAGSAGVLPAVMVTLLEEKKLERERAVLSLLAAGAVGSILAERATFAAEVAGCQVEIGAAGAMGAAAVVDAAGGTARQACDAAAISFQNTMGSICDLVQGIVEIPCHTRNAVAASSAFVCADLILGGYENPIPLDETIDAVYAVGKMLPPELRCTALGGLAVTPSALALQRIRREGSGREPNP